MNSNKICAKLINDIRHLKYIPGSEMVKINVIYAIMGGLLGGLGLLYNSKPVVLGSMLISPLVASIFKAITGILTSEMKYVLEGSINLVLLASICVLIGFMMGYINDKSI